MVITAKALDLRGPSIDSHLVCPACGFENGLHHGAVTVYDREEDAALTSTTRVMGNVVTASVVPSELSKNPSMRRDGIAIDLWCEACGTPGMQLTVEQHKGATILKARVAR